MDNVLLKLQFMELDFCAGHYVNQGYYKAFIPEEINREWIISDMEVFQLLSGADRQLGRLDMYSEYVNIDLFIKTHIANEATLSSRIEGTQTHIEDAFLEEQLINMEHRDDWKEVQNYIEAMHSSINLLTKLPLSNRLIRDTHSILLSGVRGKHKEPGQFRTSQNWIGGSNIDNAVFVPPPHTEVPRLMSDLELFIHNNDVKMPDLLKIAIIHFQFETIHPFLDGNGRVGRLLITLYLVAKGILRQPILYLSAYFERNRSMYYEYLMRARTENDINSWLKFFLKGVIETSKNGVATFDNILSIQRTLDERLSPLGSSAHDGKLILNEMFDKPVRSAKEIREIIGKSDASTYKLIEKMEQIGVLKEITGAQRNKRYAFQEYLSLFDK